MTSDDSKITKIQSQFQALSSVAASLNTASDELTKAIGDLDEALKKLNVGLTVWVTFRSRGYEDPQYDDDQIGYSKVNGKWGIALRHIWGDDTWDRHEEEGPWLFSDGPREMRLYAVDGFSKLIEALGKEAFDTTKKMHEKIQEVCELTGAIKNMASKPGPSKERK